MPRDPKAFREFMTRSENQIVSPYEHFYMREALKKGDTEAIYQKIKELSKNKEMNAEEIEAKYTQIENMIMNYQKMNTDEMNLSRAVDNHVKVEFDL